MFAVIPARNEASRIASAIRNVRLAGATEIVVVVNGCHDGTRAVVRTLQASDLTVITFREALGVDIPAPSVPPTRTAVERVTCFSTMAI